MKDTFEFEAQPRTGFGKASMRRMRRLDSNVPAVVYGAKKDPVSIQIPYNVISHKLETPAFYSSVLNITLGTKTEKVILKAVQWHPSRGEVQHLDFLRIDEKKKLTIQVPIHFINEDQSPGIKAGGVASYLLNEVEISCLPANIPQFIEVDISEMENGDVLHLSSVKIPEGTELMSKPEDQPIVTVAEPKVQTEPESEEEGAEGEGEGEEVAADEEGKGEEENKE